MAFDTLVQIQEALAERAPIDIDDVAEGEFVGKVSGVLTGVPAPGSAPVVDAVLTYDVDGQLESVDYSDGGAKTLAYVGGVLDEVVYTLGAYTLTTTLIYDIDGNLTDVQRVES